MRKARPPGVKCMFCTNPGTTNVTIGSFSVIVDRQHVDMALDTYLHMVSHDRAKTASAIHQASDKGE